jgi:homoserine acetyltransferase
VAGDTVLPSQREADMTSAYDSQDIHGPFETHELGDFDLEQGGKIRNLTLAYATSGSDLKGALARIKAKTFVIAIDEDGFFPLADLAAEQELVPGSTLKRISPPWGHLALFGMDPHYCKVIDTYLNELLQAP